jgi:hypothetical protein
VQVAREFGFCDPYRGHCFNDNGSASPRVSGVPPAPLHSRLITEKHVFDVA